MNLFNVFQDKYEFSPIYRQRGFDNVSERTKIKGYVTRRYYEKPKDINSRK